MRLLLALHFDLPHRRKRFEEELSISLALHPAVEDDDDAAVVSAADQPAEPLLELDDRLRHRVIHEGISTGALDCLEPRFDHRLIRHGEGELDDDYIAQLIA